MCVSCSAFVFLPRPQLVTILRVHPAVTRLTVYRRPYIVSKQYFSRPATFCKNDPSGLSMRFRRFFLIFSGSNQRISISLRQSRVPIPKNDPTTPPWSHKFEEQSLSNDKVGFVVQKLHGPEILKMQNFARRCPLRSRTQKNSALPGAAR